MRILYASSIIKKTLSKIVYILSTLKFPTTFEILITSFITQKEAHAHNHKSHNKAFYVACMYASCYDVCISTNYKYKTMPSPLCILYRSDKLHNYVSHTY